MYGKFFASTFTGSMFGAGPDVFAVWGYVIANTVDSSVELNPQLLAAVLGTNPDAVVAAIDVLCRPDNASRSIAEDGRRIIAEGGFQYRVVNHAHYRALRNEEERRAYNREAKNRERAKKSNAVKRNVNDMSAVSAQAEAEAEAETDTKAKPSDQDLPVRAPRSLTKAEPEAFTTFWKAYPKKTGKGAALKAWTKLSPPIEAVLSSLEWQCRQPDWLRDQGQFIPHPATWLNRRGWEDEPFNAPAYQPPVQAKPGRGARLLQAGRDVIARQLEKQKGITDGSER